MADQPTTVQRRGAGAVIVDTGPQGGFLAIIRRIAYSFGLLRESWPAMIGLGIIVFWVLVAIFADVLAPYGYAAQNPDLVPFADPNNLDAPLPSAEHWLGVDSLGRDLLSRIMYGARTVLIVAPIAVLSAYIVGCTIGLVGGYYGGIVDDILQRISDIILAFPLLILYIVLIAAWGQSAFNVILAVMIGAAPGVGRITRGLVLDIRNQEYVQAAQIRGESSFFIMLVELLPNARGPLIVDSCLRLGYVTITIGSLGFLGLGLPPPNPDWGGMVSSHINQIQFFPHMAIFPAIAISSLVVGFNLLADGLREIDHKD